MTKQNENILTNPLMLKILRAIADGEWHDEDEIAFKIAESWSKVAEAVTHLQYSSLVEVAAESGRARPPGRITESGLEALSEVNRSTAPGRNMLSGMRLGRGGKVEILGREVTRVGEALAQAEVTNTVVANSLTREVTVYVYHGESGFEYFTSLDKLGSLETFGAPLVHTFIIVASNHIKDEDVAGIARQLAEQMMCDLCPPERPGSGTPEE